MASGNIKMHIQITNADDVERYCRAVQLLEDARESLPWSEEVKEALELLHKASDSLGVKKLGNG